MLGLENSASASSAAFFIDCAAAPALPPALKGKISATRAAPNPGPVDGSGAADPAAFGPVGAVSAGPPIGPSAVEQPASARPIQQRKARAADNRRLSFPSFAVRIISVMALEAIADRPRPSGPKAPESKEYRAMRRALCGCSGAR